jgi:hypothetical protein
MSNNYLDSNLVLPHAVAILKSVNSLLRLGNREYEGRFTARTYAPGSTLNIRLDNFMEVQRGDVVTPVDIVEASKTLTILPLFSVPITYTPTDLQRDIISFVDEVIAPGVRAISSQLNNTIAQTLLTQVSHYTGDITAPLNTFKSISSVNPVMTSLNMNNYQRLLVVDPYNLNELQSSSTLQNSFLPSLNKEITLDAKLGRLAGFEVFQDTSLSAFVSGTHTASGNITVTTAVSSGTTIILGGFTSGATVLPGDLFSLAGVYEYDRVGRKQLPINKQFCVVIGGTAGGGGTIAITFAEALVADGPRQNFIVPGASPNQIPVNAVATFLTNSTNGFMNNAAFTTRGLALAIPPLERMDSPYSFVHTDPDSGISMRISKTAEVLNNKNVLRLDAQLAVTWINDQAVRLVSKLAA